MTGKWTVRGAILRAHLKITKSSTPNRWRLNPSWTRYRAFTIRLKHSWIWWIESPKPLQKYPKCRLPWRLIKCIVNNNSQQLALDLRQRYHPWLRSPRLGSKLLNKLLHGKRGKQGRKGRQGNINTGSWLREILTKKAASKITRIVLQQRRGITFRKITEELHQNSSSPTEWIGFKTNHLPDKTITLQERIQGRR